MQANQRASLLRNPYFILFAFLAVVGYVFRFTALEDFPRGVFVDEQAAMANVICIIRNGVSTDNKPYPVYFSSLGGFYDPIFMYTQVAFAKIFGASIGTFRLFPSLCLLAACFGTAALAWTFLGLDAAILALVTSLFCPWSFHAGRLVWGSGVFTAFITWGLFFLWRTKFTADEGKTAYLWAVLSGISLACAMSLYRPANAVVLALIMLLFAMRSPAVAIRFRYLLTALAAIMVCGTPNFLFISGNGWGRIDSLSIFGKAHLATLDGSYLRAAGEVLENFRMLLSWNFLFVSGDANFRHTPAWGALGWPECVGLLCLGLVLLHELAPWKKQAFLGRGELAFLTFCAGAVLIGLLPSAQSWDSNPHALRANASWPFFVLLATIGLTTLFRQFSTGPMLVSLVFLIYIPVFLSHYFITFPALGDPWFDADLSRAAKFARSSGNWKPFAAIVKNYGPEGPPVFPMLYSGMSCNDAAQFVENLRPHSPAPIAVATDSATPGPLAQSEVSTSPGPVP